MSEGTKLAILFVFLSPLARAGGPCPVTLITGTGSEQSLSITFMNTGKLLIRQLEFNCKLAGTRSEKTGPIHCDEENALFFPGTQYTVNYAYPAHLSGLVRVSLKSLTFADGRSWKPPKSATCRAVKIYLKHRKGHSPGAERR